MATSSPLDARHVHGPKPDSHRPLQQFSWLDFGSYGLLTMPLAMAGLTLLTYLPTYYAIDLGLGLATVGTVFAIGRILDVITDPLLGHWSDQTRSRFGPRKPWMAAGVVGYCLSVWLLLAPPSEIGIGYLVAVGAGFFLFLTMLDVPYSAVGLELSDSPEGRTKLASSKAAFQVAGALLAGALPLLLGATIAETLPWIGAIVVVLTLVGFGLFAARIHVPERQARFKQDTVWDGIKALAGFAACRRLIGTFAVVQMANAFFTGLAVLFITQVLQAEAMVGGLIALMFLATALFLPLWQALAKRFGKLSAWRVAIITSCVALAILPLAAQGNVVLAGVVFFIIGGTFGGDAILPTSMLADLAHQQEVSGQRRQAGLFLAVKNAASKLSFVAPMAIAFPILGWIGFEQSSSRPEYSVWVFICLFALVPILLKLLALSLLRRETRFGALGSSHE